MGDFSQIDNTGQNIPFAPPHSMADSLGLINPDNVLSGTNRGSQNLGSPNIVTDPAGTRIRVNDNTTNRVSFGKIGTGVNDWGLKVSQPGYNVDTATNAQLIFNSSQDVFKIILSDTTTIPALTVTAGQTHVTVSTTVTFPTALTFAPAFLIYYFDDVANAYKLLAGDSSDTIIASSNNGTALTNITTERFTFYSQPTKLTLYRDVYLFDPAPTYATVRPEIIIKYFVLQESVSS